MLLYKMGGLGRYVIGGGMALSPKSQEWVWYSCDKFVILNRHWS